MFHIIITLDYELPSGGQGDVRRHMVEPTNILFEVCEKLGAKLTIMVEMGELWAFEKAENAGFKERLRYEPAIEIKEQLVGAIMRGHDVQFHLHPQWINARWSGTCWDLDYAHYHLTDFDDTEAVKLLQAGKKDLEVLLRPHRSDYECVGFRAGHWNTQPSEKYLRILHDAGLKSDTSVFKWGYANTSVVTFDYRDAYSNTQAWYAQDDDINQCASGKGILEVPIATELTRSFKMLTPKRLWLARNYLREDGRISAGIHEAKKKGANSPGPISKLQHIFDRHPKKLDFCKLTGRQMSRMIKNLMSENRNQQNALPVPLVMIGHSKQVGTAKALSRFLRISSEQFGSTIRFSTYCEFIQAYMSANNAK
jgi:hypothetical protein